MAYDRCFHLSHLIETVRDRMHGNTNDADDEIAEMTAAVFDENLNWDIVELDVPLNGEIEENIFNALVSSGDLYRIRILPNVEVRSVEAMLGKAIPEWSNLEAVDIASALTESEAERIFSILRRSVTLNEITLFLGDCSDGIAKPLAQYLRESTTVILFTLTWGKLAQAREERATFVAQTSASPMSQAALSYIYDGISECQSLDCVILGRPPSDNKDRNMAAESFATAIAKSTSLEKFLCPLEFPGFLLKLHDTLLQTDAVKNFDLCFSWGQDLELQVCVLTLKRNAPWKQLLSKNVPLALWPRILARTNSWNKDASHSPLDALNFLVKEKCAVLLQNVHRRKIRKRKRYQIS